MVFVSLPHLLARQRRKLYEILPKRFSVCRELVSLRGSSPRSLVYPGEHLGFPACFICEERLDVLGPSLPSITFASRCERVLAGARQCPVGYAHIMVAPGPGGDELVLHVAPHCSHFVQNALLGNARIDDLLAMLFACFGKGMDLFDLLVLKRLPLLLGFVARGIDQRPLRSHRPVNHAIRTHDTSTSAGHCLEFRSVEYGIGILHDGDGGATGAYRPRVGSSFAAWGKTQA
jgi:hypothetical protein